VRRSATHVAALLSVLLAGPVGSQDLSRIGLPLLVSTPTPPIPVRADGRFRLVYELHLTNTSRKPVTLNRVAVRGSDASSGADLAVVEGAELSKAIKPTAADAKEPRTIGPGAHAVIMMWVTLDASPGAISHRLEGTEGIDPEPLTLESVAVPVRGAPVRLAPPLRGDRWLAANGPSNDTHHRRSWFAYGGRALSPERFAIDFLRLHESGPTVGDPAENRSWRGYGEEVIAVADARVASITDGIADNVPANRLPSGMTMDTMGGNLVVLDLGDGVHVYYSHLQPGSIRVRQGDRVRVGQILGLVGNSGNSNAPHLHFQVSAGPALLLSDGVPFVFDSFVHEGKPRTSEIPLQNWIVSFR
jgi:murein DD-endopeptidase